MTVLNFPSVESEWIRLCYGTKDEACHSVPWGLSFTHDASCPGGYGPILGQNFGRKSVLFCFVLWLFEGVDKKLKEGSFGGWGWGVQSLNTHSSAISSRCDARGGTEGSCVEISEPWAFQWGMWTKRWSHFSAFAPVSQPRCKRTLGSSSPAELFFQ